MASESRPSMCAGQRPLRFIIGDSESIDLDDIDEKDELEEVYQ